VNLSQVDFDALTLADLQAQVYTTEPIRGTRDETNELPPGSVIGVLTDEGNHAKIQVLTYGYDLEIRFVTYRG